jgi:phosphotransferase system HPr (HPr) family protein
MVERTLLVTAPLGLHARAAAKLVRVANGFRSQVLLQRVDGASSPVTGASVLTSGSADAKSILSILMLAASHGTQLRARAEGVDEEAAIAAIEKLFTEGFGEAGSRNPQ